jgi:hypothetical protein
VKVARGLAVTLVAAIAPVPIGIVLTRAAIGLGMRGMANASLGFAFLWADAVGPHPVMLLVWVIVGVVLGLLTVERSLARTVTTALIVVPIVTLVSFEIARALGHHPHGGI